MDIYELVPTAEMRRTFQNANFGSMDDRDVVKMGLLKCASGYHQGSTSKAILQELGLITMKYTLTKKGKQYLWAAFAEGSNF
jgi:hypothetical protein